MKKTSNFMRLLCLGLCAVLLLGMVPVFASAQTPETSVSAACNHEDGTLSAYPNEDDLTHTFVWSCCGGTFTAEHAQDVEGTTVPPTCEGYGYTEYYCSVCGGFYHGSIVDPLGHSQSGELLNSPPTCTELGYDYYVCDTCGVSIIVSFEDTLDHTPGEAYVVAPGCDTPGYTQYICRVCGAYYEADPVPATGHSFDKNGICVTCGRDSANVVTITMTDAFGDGWNGNGITIIEDGGYMYMATLEEGSEGTYSFLMDPSMKYKFLWSQGEFAEECAFTISILGEEVCSAAFGDCASFSYGQVLYPVCEHNYEVSGVIEPTCTDYGYTTYTCTVCGDSYDMATEDFLGHTRSSAALVVPPSCLMYGYTCCGCTVCGDIIYYDLLPITGHTLGEDGSCSVCGEPFCVPLVVAGIDVTYENYQDILGDGTASFDPDTNTLTLKDFHYDGDLSGVYTQIPLNIVLEGDNFITVGSFANSGIYIDSVGGDFTITGTGSLTVVSAGYAVYTQNYGDTSLTLGGSISITAVTDYANAIYLFSNNNDLVIKDSARLTLGTGENPIGTNAIYMYGETSDSVTIADNACVNIHAVNGRSICSDSNASSLTVSDDAYFYASGEDCGVDVKDIAITGGTVTVVCGSNDIAISATNMTVTDGTVTAIGGYESGGIYVWDKFVITGGAVRAEAEFDGLTVGNLSVSGGKVIASGDAYGINVSRGCVITGGTVEVLDGGLTAIMVDEYGNTIEGDAVILGENMQITEPEGAYVSDTVTDGYWFYTGIADADGNEVDAFVITGVHDAHHWAGGVCSICGTPFTLTASGFTLSFEEEILVNFYYSICDTAPVVEQGMLVFGEETENPNYEAADWVYSSVYIPETDLFMGQTDGIAAKEMGDERYYCAYAKLTDGTYAYSALYQYSPEKYATNMLGRDTTSAKQKALCVAMLNYGAAAQNYFGYKTGDLMNASLTAEQQALVMGFDAALFKGAVAADPSKVGAFAATAAGFNSKTATVSFEGAFAINYYFAPSGEVAGDMKLYIWNPETYAAASTLTADNASAVISMEAQASGAYWGQVEGIAAKALDDTYYVAGVYTDAQGNTCCTGVIAYSLSRYCINNANGNMGQLAQSTAMYGYCANTYFANK